MTTQYGPDNPAPGTRLWRLRNHPETLTMEDAVAVARDLDRLRSEAVSRFAEALRTAVEGLRGYDGTGCAIAHPHPWDRVERATVLSEIERLSQAPADTGEGA